MQISSKQSNSEEVFSSAVHVEKSSNLGILIILKLKGIRIEWNICKDVLEYKATVMKRWWFMNSDGNTK